ncbi:MAG: (Fe-S)-binding protein [Acidimicrobiales bacterium]
MTLHLPDEELGQCVACGLCLPHCPTFRVTGEERASPRGRIEAMRQVQWGGLPIDESFVDMMDACVQCRGCETACPSGVPFGRLMETTRETLVAEAGYQPWHRRLGYRVLGRRRLLLGLSSLLAFAQAARLAPRRVTDRLGLPRVPLRRGRLAPSGHDVWLFTGCVMDAWQRPVHAAAKRLVERTGAGVALPGPGAACCGALHEHAGLGIEARRLAQRTIAALGGDAPILVDSAGCGAMLKDYGHLLGTPEAAAFSARVYDINEWLAARIEQLPAPPPGAPRPVVAVQDPCHLRHVQRTHESVRRLLAPFVEVVELDDEGLCCGAGGAYSVLRPELSQAIRARKLDSIERSGAPLVASANPGCAMHLAAAGVAVRHPVELVDEALGGG